MDGGKAALWMTVIKMNRRLTIFQTNRSAIQCLQRYQTKLAPSLAMGPWTGEEDEALKKVVETFTFGNDTAWHQGWYIYRTVCMCSVL